MWVFSCGTSGFLIAKTADLTLEKVLQERDQDIKDLREALAEREDDLLTATNKVAELEATLAETHDRLEETLKNIERDNAEKDADLVAANGEIEAVCHVAQFCSHTIRLTFHLPVRRESLRA